MKMASVSAIFSHKSHLLLIQYKVGFSKNNNNGLWMRINFFDGVMQQSIAIWELLSNEKKSSIAGIILHNSRVSAKTGKFFSPDF